jgi:hypothetical protein
MTDAVEVQAPPIGAVEGRPGVTVVTQENWNGYVDQQVGAPAEVVVNDDLEEVAAAEAAVIEEQQAAAKVEAEAPKEGDIKGADVFFKGKWVKKHDFNYRVHLKTGEAKAELQAKIDATAAEAKTAKETAATAAKERDELRAKYEPPASLDPGAEPNEANYQDMAKFKADYREWAAKSARAEDSKQRQEAQAKADTEAATKRWRASEAELTAEIPDYAQRLANAPGAAIGVSNELRDAIFDSDNGPRLRLHLAENPEVLRALLEMPVGRMMKQVGKLEDSMGKVEVAPAKKGNTLADVQMSKAPAPITPIRGGNVVTGLKIDAAGNWTGTPEEFKAARLAGKIK